jgi:hypothetical protein
MTSYTLSPVWGAGAQLFDNSGNVLTGGKIYTYAAGTTTPAVTYTDPIGNTFNSNPIIADASGRLSNEIWLPVAASYKFVLKDTNDVLIATYDNIPTIPQPPIANDASSISYEQGYTVTAGAFTVGATYLITSVGTTNFVAIGAAANVTGILFTATGVGSGTGTAQYSRTVQSKLRETVSVKDFGAVGDGVANDTVAIQAALTAANSVFFPEGTYLTDTLTLKANQEVYGCGNSSIIKQNTTTGASYGTLYCDSGSSSSFISNITIRNLQVLGQVATQGFSEFRHLISLHGVQNVLIDSCSIVGFRGDGILLGSGTSAGQERHNQNVTISNCLINGVNNDNRNGISVIDGDTIKITNNSFTFCTRSNMPGPIDLEPDTVSYAIIKNITITNNSFLNCLGNVAQISIDLRFDAYTVPPSNFIISNNVIQSGTAYSVLVLLRNAGYATQTNVTISGNTCVSAQGFYIAGVKNVVISNNTFNVTSAGFVGFNATDVLSNITVIGNSFLGTANGLNLRGILDNINVIGNTFNGFVNYACGVGIASGTVSNMNFTGNIFSSISGIGYAVQNVAGTINGETCAFFNNVMVSPITHNFPAWRNDNCGLVSNGVTATNWNSLTPPDSFPLGISNAAVNGDTGVPATTGGYQGTLSTYRLSSIASKYTWQTYYHANNNLKLGSFFIRRSAAGNTWTAWFEVIGV